MARDKLGTIAAQQVEDVIQVMATGHCCKCGAPVVVKTDKLGDTEMSCEKCKTTWGMSKGFLDNLETDMLLI